MPRLRKALGQHHLTNREVLKPLLGFLATRSELPVVEIGVGGGVLTKELAELGVPFLACELDLAWLFQASAELPKSTVQLVAADALDLEWAALPASRITGNLPYSISTVLIEQLLDTRPIGDCFAFLVQLEVGRRIVARPGEPDYGSLSVIARLRGSWQLLGRVRPGSFRPPPKVDSVFLGVHLDRETPDDWIDLKRTIRGAFAQRRKTLRNSLASAWGRARAQAAAEFFEWPATRRVDDLTIEELVDLHRWWRTSG